MNPRYLAVATRAAHRCEYCHAPESAFNFPFEVEHVVPSASGGGEEASNLALSCRSCNVHKGSHTRITDPETGAEVPIFDPRADQWDEHFQADRKTGVIIGITVRGRATIETLLLNSTFQVRARRQWVRLGLFP